MDTLSYEISYRDSLMKKAYKGEKLSTQDRLWLVTHPVYNQQFVPAALMSDVLTLNPNTIYKIRIMIVRNNSGNLICPIIGAPDKRGKIKADVNLQDYRGNSNLGKSVHMISFDCMSENQNEVAVLFCSTTGILSVDFRCDFFDEKQHVMTRKSSRSGDIRFAMKKQCVGENKLQYQCIFPGVDSFDSLDAFVFTIEWSENCRNS